MLMVFIVRLHVTAQVYIEWLFGEKVRMQDSERPVFNSGPG